MKRIPIFILGALVMLIACNENRVFEEHTDPSGNLEWRKEQVVEFAVSIKDTALRYNVYTALRFAQGFAFAELPVEIKRVSPSGKEVIDMFSFEPRNPDGTYNGEGAGDIWDLEVLYQSGIQFDEVGTYHYTMRHLSERDLLHMVMQVGLIVDKVPTQP